MQTATPTVSWDLPTSVGYTEVTAVFFNAEVEAFITGEDGRQLVPSQDIKKGGRYRAICKVVAVFSHPTDKDKMLRTECSGILYDEETVVTVGHCTYIDMAGVEITCIIGYNGEDDASGQPIRREGCRVIVPFQWYASHSHRHDVAMIKLREPFPKDQINIIPIHETPVKVPAEEHGQSFKIGVVGYPGDKQQGNHGERGAQMYEDFTETQFDLALTQDHMIEYRVSTAVGQTGAPILAKNGNGYVCYGIHAYGGQDLDPSLGVPFGGLYGVDLKSMHTQLNDERSYNKLVASLQNRKNQRQPIQQTLPEDPGKSLDAEFDKELEKSCDDFHNALPELTSRVPCWLAGTLFRSIAGSGNTSKISIEAAMNRSVFVDSCLHVFHFIWRRDPMYLKLASHMQSTWLQKFGAGAIIKRYVPLLAPKLAECAYVFACDKDHLILRAVGTDPLFPKYKDTTSRHKDIPLPSGNTPFTRGFHDSTELAGLRDRAMLENAMQVVKGALEDVDDWSFIIRDQSTKAIDGILTGLKPVPSQLQPHDYLPWLHGSGDAPSQSSDAAAKAAESLLLRITPPASSSYQTTETVLQRALLGEACFEAFNSLSAEELKSIKMNVAWSYNVTLCHHVTEFSFMRDRERDFILNYTKDVMPSLLGTMSPAGH